MWPEHPMQEGSIQTGQLPRARSFAAPPERLEGSVAAKALEPQCAILAHELRGPLSVLSANIDAIEERVDTAPDVAEKWLRDALAIQQRAVSHLQTLLNMLLEAFRLESGPRELRRESFDLCELVRDVIRMQSDTLKASNCSCSILATGPVVGAWDRVRLSIAISNLIDNARKYGRGRPIEATIGGDASWVWVSVRDYGVGIDMADSQRIFEPFARVRSVPAVSGFGLGLWLVRAIAHAHGGAINLDSAVGQGSSFELRLPRNPEQT